MPQRSSPESRKQASVGAGKAPASGGNAFNICVLLTQSDAFFAGRAGPDRKTSYHVNRDGRVVDPALVTNDPQQLRRAFFLQQHKPGRHYKYDCGN